MDSGRARPTASDIAELQRDCHPFPAYIDYIYGRPTEYERLQNGIEPSQSDEQSGIGSLPDQNTDTDVQRAVDGPAVPAPAQLLQTKGLEKSATPAPTLSLGSDPSPHPVYPGTPPSVFADLTIHHYQPQGSSLAIESSFVNTLPGTPPSMLVKAPASSRPPTQANPVAAANQPDRSKSAEVPPQALPRIASNQASLTPYTDLALAAPRQNVTFLERDDMLKPAYSWLPQHIRVSINAKIGELRDALDKKDLHATTRSAVLREVAAISMRIHDARQRAYLSLIHQHLPQIWDAIAIVKEYPNHPTTNPQRQLLTVFKKQFEGSTWDYITKILVEMEKKRLEGKVPYEAIPGWLERWNKANPPMKAQNEGAEREGELAQSKGESSPLPQWKH